MQRMKRRSISIILCCIAVFLCSCCQEKAPASHAAGSDTAVHDPAKPAGLSFPIEALSNPSYFDQDAAVFQAFFPRPSSAVFHHDGKQDAISAEDPRLNRLMNLLEDSQSNHKTVWRQGLVPEEELAEWLDRGLPILVIQFSQGSEPEGIDPVKQIIVCGAECLVEYPEQNGTHMIEEHWPCAQYLCDPEAVGSIAEDEYLYDLEHARESPWFDLLAYVGFQS